MTYRFLDSSDAKTVADFNGKYFSDGWNLKQLEGAFNQSGFSAIGCFFNEWLIGFISYSVAFETSDLDDVVVSPDYRNQRIATNLLDKCLQHIKDLGVKQIMLEVRKSNTPAISLYKKAGFKEVSQRKKYYSDGEDALVFKKELL